MNQPPFFLAGHRISIAAAQVTQTVHPLQFLDSRGIAIILFYEKLDCPFVLLAALDQQILFCALCLKRNFGSLQI